MKLKLTYKQKYESVRLMNKYLLIMFVGIIFMMAGASSNFTAIKSNDCRMPVYQSIVETVDADEYFSFWDKSEVNYFYLTDRFMIGEGMNSLGDFSLLIGVFILLFNLFNIITYRKIKKYGTTIK